MIALSVQLLVNIIPAIICVYYAALIFLHTEGDVALRGGGRAEGATEFKRSLVNQHVLRRRMA